MKKIISSAVLIMMISFISCGKENHKIRLQNNYPQTVLNASAGTANFGDVGFGGISEYQSINTGDFTISGRTNSGQQLTGSGSIKGKGTHKWTLTLTNAGGVTIKED